MRVFLTRRIVLAIGATIVLASAAPQGSPDHPPAAWLVEKLPPQEVARLETLVARNPNDVESRIRLLYAYVADARNERRAHHLLWLIEHHPEALGPRTSVFVHSGEGPLQDVLTYERAAHLWKQQVALHPSSPRIVANAAAFFHSYYMLKDPMEAEAWVLRARAMNGGDPTWTWQLAMYLRAIAWGDQGSSVDRAYAAHVREVLRTSTDGELLWRTGNLLAHSIAGDTRDVAAAGVFGETLMKRAEKLGFQPPAHGAPHRPAGSPR